MQHRKYLIWVVFFCYFSTVYAIAQHHFAKNPVNGDYFREWLVIGPFFPDDLVADFWRMSAVKRELRPQQATPFLRQR
ncbi:MAG: hypothetical protein R3C26_13895 [Calditrichia bacterium]